jgi:hypothetical protein
MQVRSPALSPEQITKWMQAAATEPRPEQTGERSALAAAIFRRHPGFDFKSARQSLGRARAKNDIDTIKPLRRLRRNQGAINEALIDALSALIGVNKQMAAEIAGLSGELASLRERLAQTDTRENSGGNAGQI